MAIGAAGPSALWYLTRASGAVTLVLLTVTVVLGVANVSRAQAPGWPRFVVEGVHRNASLLAIVMLGVHIATTALDPFASISLINALVPFTGSYRPLWLGLGAVASDVLIAVALTSLVRRRLGHRAWRATHWLAYLCWPVAVVHGLGTGSDARSFWLLAITAACVIAVVVSVWARAAYGWPGQARLRVAAVAASIGLPILLAIWASGGPLARGWAARAGTPAALLAHTTPGQTASHSSAPALPTLPLSTTVRGAVAESQTSSGVEVNISLASPDAALRELDVRIYGSPLAGGGVAMTSSAVTAGSGANPSAFSGVVTALEGNEIRARVAGPSGAAIELDLVLTIDAATGGASGTLGASGA